MRLILITLAIFTIIVVGCTQTINKQENIEEDLTNICSQEQKENKICTREYNPVCANDGKTYSTACVACSSGLVDSWEQGECEKTKVEVTDFNSCVKAGNPIMESYPEQCVYEGVTYTKELSKQELCENLNSGTYDVEFKECLGITKETCDAIGGIFSECESACRNNPEALICTMQCVQVCDLE